MQTLYQIIISTVVGTVLGAVFALLKLPSPAPTVFAGIAGIFGIWLGATIVAVFITKV